LCPNLTEKPEQEAIEARLVVGEWEGDVVWDAAAAMDWVPVVIVSALNAVQLPLTNRVYHVRPCRVRLAERS
jgi:hypothetical protein